MSDELTTPPTTPAPGPGPAPVAPASRRGDVLPVLVQAAIIVVVFAVVGVVGGLLWEAAWTPEPGEVLKHVWYPISWDRAMPTDFAGTGWYVVIGMVAGVIVGGLAAWLLDRAELVTLAAVVVGGLLAAYLMRVVGLHRGPGDPQQIAKTAPDRTKLPSELRLASWWLLTVVPGAALAALGVVFLTVSKRGARKAPRPKVEAPIPG